MGASSGDHETLRSDLRRLPADQRPARLARAGAPPAVVSELARRAEHWVISDLTLALEDTAWLVELADRLDAPVQRSETRRARAQALAYANRFVDALQVLDESAALAEEAADAGSAARARLSMVHPLARLGRYDEGIASGKAALAGFEHLGLGDWAAKARANIGVTHRMAGDPAAALACFDLARAGLTGDAVSLAQVDSSRADVLLELNRFAEAEAAFRWALQAFEEAGMTRAAAIAEGNLADVLGRQGRIEQALFHYERVRRRLEADDAGGDLARLEAEQAEAFFGAGMLEQAADVYAAAIPALVSHGLAAEAARARASLGRALLSLDRHDDACVVLAEALQQFSALGNGAGAAGVQILQGQLALDRGDPTEARALLGEALAALAERPVEAAMAHRLLALAAIGDRDVPGADAAIAAAFDAAGGHQLAPLLADLHHTRARVHMAAGRPGPAIEDLRAAVCEVERLRGSLQADRLRAAFAGSRSAVYEDLVIALLDHGPGGRIGEAFAAVEQARSRALLDLLAGAVSPAARLPSHPEPADDALLPGVVGLRGELNALYSRMPPEPAALALWSRQIRDRERALEHLESRLACTARLGGFFAPPADLAAAQQMLGDDDALVEYFIANDEVIAFVVRRGDVAAYRRLATRSTLQEAVELLRFQLDRAMSFGPAGAARDQGLLDDARRELEELHGILLAPLHESLAGARRVAIVPYGPMHGVPFHALQAAGTCLLESAEVVYAPSAGLLSRLPAAADDDRRRDRRANLVFGVADEQAPRIVREIESVAEALIEPRVFVGRDASWECLQREAPQAGVVHLACHGWFSGDTPLGSRLKLSDRWVSVRDLYGLRLNGAVVVLTGCDTARSRVHQGEEMVGLIQAFLAAGASALLMSLWAVHDDTAQNLVASVYRLWHNGGRCEEGGRLSAALREAQCGMKETYPHPLFWAPFILVGRP